MVTAWKPLYTVLFCNKNAVFTDDWIYIFGETYLVKYFEHSTFYKYTKSKANVFYS